MDNNAKIYKVHATEEDLKACARINTLIERLKGVNYLREWRLPDYLEAEADKIGYVQRRFVSAPALAGFKVKSTLRSSRAALLELIYGTVVAAELIGFPLQSGKQHTGNLVHTLQKQQRKRPTFYFPQEWIPENSQWILEEEPYRAACEEEIRIYKQIGDEVLSMSDSRERAKVTLLRRQAGKLGKVLAFDATLITLDYIYHLLQKYKSEGVELILATGSEEAGKRKVREAFSHGSTHDGKKVIALCSDSMSEGINLPAAKVLVLLDLPSVPRIIEQRIGRIERIDSEHAQISVYWPEDDDPFSLKSDKRLVDTFTLTGLLIGNNMVMPQEGSLSRYFSSKLDTQGTIEGFQKYREEDGDWQGVQDTTSLLQSFFHGKEALIKPHIYETYKDVEASVKTAISFIESDRAWSFFALRGDVRRSAKWLFIEEGRGTTDFTEISRKLKAYLSNTDIMQRRWADVALHKEFSKLLHFLRKHEALLLPHKKKRALKIGERLLQSFVDTADKDAQDSLIKKAEHLLKWHQLHDDLEAVDLHHFADLWLQILQPALDERRKAQKRKRKPLSLDDLATTDVPITNVLLDFLLDEGQSASKIDEVVASCIISLKHS